MAEDQKTEVTTTEQPPAVETPPPAKPTAKPDVPPAPPEVIEPPWAPPTVEVGESVHWWPKADRGRDPCAAMVTAIHGVTVDLVIMLPGSTRTEASVPHVDDPRFETTGLRFRDSGAWDLHPQRKKLDEMYNVMQDMGVFEEHSRRKASGQKSKKK